MIQKERKINGRAIVIGLLVVLGLLSIVYAVLSVTLNVKTNNASIEPWNVQFTSAAPQSDASNSGVDLGTCTLESENKKNDTVKISDLKIYDFGGEAVYKVVIKNTGSLTAELKNYAVSVKDSSENDLSSDFTVKLQTYESSAYHDLDKSSPKDASNNAIQLAGGAEKDFYIRVTYKSRMTASEELGSAGFTITLQPYWEQVVS